jgi:hypothetical protein
LASIFFCQYPCCFLWSCLCSCSFDPYDMFLYNTLLVPDFLWFSYFCCCKYA